MLMPTIESTNMLSKFHALSRNQNGRYRIQQSITFCSKLKVCHHLCKLRISRTSLHRNLKLDLKLHKIYLVQNLESNDINLHKSFVKVMLNECNNILTKSVRES